jgi:glutamyl-Q tRNA(Asp) synthetase
MALSIGPFAKSADDWVARVAARLPDVWRTRFAPAPTGWLHLGHAVNAVMVWGLARAHGGAVLLRLEDHDRGRCRDEYAQGILDDLDWLGLSPDVAPTAAYRGGPALRQSARGDRYAAVLSGLAARGLAYACRCSRREIAAQQPDGADELVYPGTCRDAGVEWGGDAGVRITLAPSTEPFDDLIVGAQVQQPHQQCGDLLVRDRTGNWTYQFAVTVDDCDQAVDVVIRGEDLLASTGRQLALARLVGRPAPPLFAHHTLVRQPDGAKLSKSTGSTGLRELRAAGWSAAAVLGHAAALAGLQSTDRSISAADLPALFVR